MDPFFNGRDQRHRLFIRDGRPEYLTAGLFQTHGLLHTARKVRRGHVQHRLHCYTSAAANGHASRYHLF